MNTKLKIKYILYSLYAHALLRMLLDVRINLSFRHGDSSFSCFPHQDQRLRSLTTLTLLDVLVELSQLFLSLLHCRILQSFYVMCEECERVEECI